MHTNTKLLQFSSFSGKVGEGSWFAKRIFGTNGYGTWKCNEHKDMENISLMHVLNLHAPGGHRYLKEQFAKIQS